MDRRLLEGEEPTASPRRSPETHGSQRVPRSPQPANAARAPSTDGSPGPPRPAGSRLVPGLSQRTVRPAASRPSVYAGAARLALIGTCPPRCRFLVCLFCCIHVAVAMIAELGRPPHRSAAPTTCRSCRWGDVGDRGPHRPSGFFRPRLGKTIGMFRLSAESTCFCASVVNTTDSCLKWLFSFGQSRAAKTPGKAPRWEIVLRTDGNIIGSSQEVVMHRSAGADGGHLLGRRARCLRGSRAAVRATSVR